MAILLIVCIFLGTIPGDAVPDGTILVNPGSPGLITLPAEQENPDEYLASQHLNKALAAIDAYAAYYEDYAFSAAIQVLEKSTYQAAARDVTFKDGNGNSYLDGIVTIDRTLPRTFGVPSSVSMWSYIHELTHKIEDDHGDIGYTSGITQYSIAYGERNIEFIESVLGKAIPVLIQFEADVARKDYVQAEVRWKAFVRYYENAIQAKFYEQANASFAPDFKLLKEWMGFDVDRYAIETHYRSGNAGGNFKEFFSRDLGGKKYLSTAKKGDYVLINNTRYLVVNPTNGYLMVSPQRSNMTERNGLGKTMVFSDSTDPRNKVPTTIRAFLDNWYDTYFPDDLKISIRPFGGDFDKVGILSLAEYKEHLQPIDTPQYMPWTTTSKYFFINNHIWLRTVTEMKDMGGYFLRMVFYSISNNYWSTGGPDDKIQVAPALYLNPAVPLIRGAGTYADPYLIYESSDTAAPTPGSSATKTVIPQNVPGIDFSSIILPQLTKSRTIRLTLNSKEVVVDGWGLYMDTAPEVVNNRTNVPLRFLAESLGARVDYVPAYGGKKAIFITGMNGSSSNYITLYIGEKTITHNGVTEQIDSAPYARDGRTYIPARVICEKLGAEVEWLPKTNEILITK